MKISILKTFELIASLDIAYGEKILDFENNFSLICIEIPKVKLTKLTNGKNKLFNRIFQLI